MKFPTTEIQSILDPVSLQVQTFVELHSFGEKGHSIPDITEPCNDVRRHIGKLIDAGKSQAKASPDNAFMQEEMPNALEPLQLSSELLDQSSRLIKKDGKSSSGRSTLIDACRNILFGTYKVLIVNDENTVRRLETNIKILMDSFYCVEAAKSVQEVVEFLKGVYEPFYKVIEEVNNRAKILTNKDCSIALEFHTDLLAKLLEPFVNAAKLVFSTQYDRSSSHMYAERCRMFFIKRILDEFALIRKFLRLSSAGMNSWNLSEKLTIGLELQPGDENCSINEHGAIIRNHLYNIKSTLLERSNNWIDNDNETDENLGFLFLNNLLSEVSSLADAIEQIAGDRETADRIRSKCDVINQTALQLSELRKNGKGASAEARQLQQVLRHTLSQLVDLCDETCLRHISSSNGILHPLPSTMNGLLDEVRTWLQNPDFHAVTGSECLDAIIKLAWNFARILGGDDQNVLKHKCTELIKPMNDLVDLAQQQKGSGEEGRKLVSTLHSGIADLIQAIRSNLSQEIVAKFTDPHVTINRLVQAAKSSDGIDEAAFNQKLDNFQHFARGAVVTGSQFSQLNESDDQETLQNIARCSKQLDDLIPIVSSAAQLVYYSETSKRSNEESAESMKQLNDLQNLWVDTMNQLVAQIDSVADLELFLESSELKIQEILKECLTSLQNQDCRKFVENSTRVVNCLNRVRQVCEIQSKSLEDEATIQQIQQQSSNLASQVEPFVALATTFAKNPKNPQVVADFHETSHEILDIMSVLKGILREYFGPKMISVNQADGRHYTSSLNFFITPLLPHEDAAVAESLTGIEEEEEPEDTPPPRPPPPASVTLIPLRPEDDQVVEEEEEEEVVEAPAPEEDKPILQAAHELHVEVRQWQSEGNDIIAAAKRMALLLAKMSRIVRGEEGTKIDLIETAKQIAEAAMLVYKLAHEVAAKCQERKIKRNLQNVAHKIPTLATQLNILSTVKATTLGGTATGSKDDIEATEMLVLNAQNIMTSVKDAVRASEAASIRIRLDSGHILRWVRKKASRGHSSVNRSASLMQKQQQMRRLIHREANLE